MTQNVAIVTGGTRGIGLEITKGLVSDGYKVIAFYFGNDDAAKKCEQQTGAIAMKVDVSNFDDCQKALAIVKEEYGEVSVLVNNAGITRDGVMHKMNPDDWHMVLSTNLTSCYNMCRAVIEDMRKNNFGRIINISSINGQKGQFGQVNYSAAKAGMLGLTKALALESAAKGITVNAICPGYIKTDMTASMKPDVLDSIINLIPAKRMGNPSEIAALVSFLISEKAGFINGTTLSANGGQYMN
jgi:acetoacetyl-CoA reductase